MTTPEPPPEAILIRRVRQARRISTADAARAAGISKPWWSMIESGTSTRHGVTKPVTAKPEVLASMAAVIGLSAERMREVRPDAADIMDEAAELSGTASASIPKMGVRGRGTTTPPEESPVMLPRLVAENWHDANVRVVWSLNTSEESRLALIRRLLGLPDENGGQLRSSGLGSRA
jgi:transcriptional regulator with XRE-family HTH domain